MTIASLIVDVAANTAKLQTDVQRIHGSLDSVGSMATRLGSMMAGAFSVTAITAYAAKLVDYAGNVSDLSAQTGLAMRTIQQMDYVAGQTGSTLEAFTGAAFTLGQKLAGGGDSVTAALGKLGLSLSQVRAMTPDEYWRTVATALGTVTDATDRNALGTALMGKAFKEVAPAIVEGYNDIADAAVTAGDESIRALDAAGDALDRMEKLAKSAAVSGLGAVAQFAQAVGIALGLMSNPMNKAKDDADRLAEQMTDSSYAAAFFTKKINEIHAATGAMPQPIGAMTMSLAEQQRVEKSLTAQVEAKIEANKKALKVQEEMRQSQERFAASIKRLDTAEFFVLFAKGVETASFELETLASTVPSAVNQLIQLKATVFEADMSFETFGDRVRSTMVELPNVILQAIQGGGSIIGAAGSHIGTSLMSKFQDTFGPAIKAALPFGIGDAINALLPTLGALFGPIAEKIGSFFRSIFGGPSADELRGRQAVADFEAQLHSTLNATQQLEAGQDSWRKTVIAIRDAYMAVGLTEADALLAAERLWASSKNGGAASQAVIAEIQRIMQGGAAAAGDFAANLDSATRPRVIQIGFSVDQMPDLGEIHAEGSFATGSAGIRNFGSGTPVILHGRERVQTEAQMKDEQGRMGGEAMHELLGVMRRLPQSMKIAVADALVLAGSRA